MENSLRCTKPVHGGRVPVDSLIRKLSLYREAYPMTQDETTSPQTPSRHSSRPKRRGKIFRYLLAFVVACALWHLLYYGIPEKFSFIEDEISPSGKYRIEFYKPRYAIYAYVAYKWPFFIKIYNTELDRYVYTSNIDSIDNLFQSITWPEEYNYMRVSYGINYISEEELQ